jgi:hypothetical protein
LSIGGSVARWSGNAVLPWTTSTAGWFGRRHRIVGLLLLAVAWILLAAVARPAQASPGQQDAASNEACLSEASRTPDTTPSSEATDTGAADRNTPRSDVQTRPTPPTEQSPPAPGQRRPGNGPDVSGASDFMTAQTDRTAPASDRQTTPPVDILPVDTPPVDVSPADLVTGRVDEPRGHPD